MNIYVAKIPFRATEDEIRALFEQYGEVSNSQIIMDRETGRSRGFGFVEMVNDDEANQAIAQLNDYEFKGMRLVVNEARAREERPRGEFSDRPRRNDSGGGYGGGNRGGGGGGYGGGGYGGGGGGGRRY